MTINSPQGMSYKVKKNVTLPLLKIKPNGAPAFVRFENPMFLGKKIDRGTEADKKKEPATLAHVVNLETGEEMQIICPFLLREQLNQEYPDYAYVGKCFRITLTREPEKKYNLVGLQEIEVEGVSVAEKSADFEEPSAPASSNKPKAKGRK